MNELELLNNFCETYYSYNDINIKGRDKVREFLQIKILEYIFTQSYGDKFTLVGGSALRLFYNSYRKSFDLDFNTTGISLEEFEYICNDIKTYLLSYGYDIKIVFNHNNYYHCMFVITSNVFIDGEYKKKTSNVNLKIKMDAAEDNWNYPTDYILPAKTINNIKIKTTYANVLLSKKIIAFLSRLHDRSIAKDLYDIVFLLSITEPDYSILYEYEFINSENQLYERLFNRISEKEYEIIEGIDDLIYLLTNNEIETIDDLVNKLKKFFITK